MKALVAFSDSKSCKGGGGGGTYTILYSQHATKIGSHNGQGEVENYQTSQTVACVAQVLSSICFGKAKRIWYALHGLIFLLFYSFSSLDLVRNQKFIHSDLNQ